MDKKFKSPKNLGILYKKIIYSSESYLSYLEDKAP